MKLAIYGLGYVGSVNAACFAELGHYIMGVDVKKEKVDKINRGLSPVKEPELDRLIKKHSGERIKATLNVKEALENSEIGIVCVGTLLNSNKELDTSGIFRVFDDIVKNLNKSYLLIIRSTVPPGTIDSLKKRTNGKEIKIVMNPEFLREGSGVKDFLKPEVVVIGSSDDMATKTVRKLYKEFSQDVILTTEETAELIKYVSNSWHALKITFTNEISSIASKLGIDPYELMKIFCDDKKLNISKKYFRPGFAYGGACLPKDTSALVTLAHKNGLNLPLIENIQNSNQTHIERALKKIIETGEKEIGIIGLSFKYNGTSGDIRGSPILELIKNLTEYELSTAEKKVNISVYDPYVDMGGLEENFSFINDIRVNSLEKLIDKSKIIVIGNFMPELKELVDKLEEHHIVLDLQRAIDPSNIKKGKYIGLY